MYEELMYEELIEKAIRVFHQRSAWVPQPGDLIAHPSDGRAYEVCAVDGAVVKGYYLRDGKEFTADFPVGEVFDPNVVKQIALQLLLNPAKMN